MFTKPRGTTAEGPSIAIAAVRAQLAVSIGLTIGGGPSSIVTCACRRCATATALAICRTSSCRRRRVSGPLPAVSLSWSPIRNHVRRAAGVIVPTVTTAARDGSSRRETIVCNAPINAPAPRWISGFMRPCRMGPASDSSIWNVSADARADRLQPPPCRRESGGRRAPEDRPTHPARRCPSPPVLPSRSLRRLQDDEDVAVAGRSLSTCAAATAHVACTSCPQACITRHFATILEVRILSMGSASMSPRIATTGARPSRPPMRATTPVPATRRSSFGRNARSASSSRFAVRSSRNASSGSR